MPTRLEKIALDCKAVLDSGGCNVPHFYNALSLTSHHQRRRVVWLTDGGQVNPPRTLGGKLATNGKRLTQAAVRDAEVQVFVYAESEIVGEQLADNVIAAISKVLSTPKFQGYEVLTQQEDHVGNVNRVECYRIKFTLPLPVPDEITALGVDDYVNTTGDALTICTSVDEQCAWVDDVDGPEPDPWPDNGGDGPEDP